MLLRVIEISLGEINEVFSIYREYCKLEFS